MENQRINPYAANRRMEMMFALNTRPSRRLTEADFKVVAVIVYDPKAGTVTVKKP